MEEAISNKTNSPIQLRKCVPMPAKLHQITIYVAHHAVYLITQLYTDYIRLFFIKWTSKVIHKNSISTNNNKYPLDNNKKVVFGYVQMIFFFILQ